MKQTKFWNVLVSENTSITHVEVTWGSWPLDIRGWNATNSGDLVVFLTYIIICFASLISRIFDRGMRCFSLNSQGFWSGSTRTWTLIWCVPIAHIWDTASARLPLVYLVPVSRYNFTTSISILFFCSFIVTGKYFLDFHHSCVEAVPCSNLVVHVLRTWVHCSPAETYLQAIYLPAI